MTSSEAILYKLMDDFLGVAVGDRIDYMQKWDGILELKEKAYLKAREKVFPKVPSPPLPHSLPLDQYAGTYSHPGYREFTFSVASPESDIPVAQDTSQVLHAVKGKSEWDVVFDLEHVSGEHFICYMNTLARSPMAKMVQDPCAAEFEIGADGRVARLGIHIESSVEKIWFKRVWGDVLFQEAWELHGISGVGGDSS
ncbi:DUF3471 domain-containing protein [Candidatus Bathyarchaeota archaeon]|nr:DUF3471 domain-containing protein [Candidatus Bathyarchaeota archaeon]